MEIIYKWKGKDIKIVTKGWYNISTNRTVTQTDRKDLIYINYPKICGKPLDITEFKTENNIIIINNENSETSNINNNNDNFFRRIINYFKFRNGDVESLTDLQCNSLCTFSMNFKGKGKIMRVIDADTIEMLIYVNLNKLQTEHIYGRNKSKKISSIIPKAKNGYYGLFTIRLYYVDAAEKDTYEGEYAREEMIKLYKKYNNIIYFELVNNPNNLEKFGRQLAKLYTDSEYQNSCIEYLINLRYNDRIVAEPYNGKTKSDYLKNLPKII